MNVTPSWSWCVIATCLSALLPRGGAAQRPPRPVARPAAAAADPAAARLDALKADLAREVEARRRLTQQIVDQLYSFGELGFQEVETSRYLTGVLRDSGFAVQEGVAGIPTAWVASWGSGRPVISLGSDIDGLPQTSQWPGIPCHRPMVEGAPGHGEGHNSGLAVTITAALAARAVLQREHLPGTIRLWPGVAEEIVGAKAHYVRAGLFADVDLVLFAHVASNLSVSWGDQDATGLISALFTFEGRSAHAAGAPWLGRSALDAVELMDAGWNYRREHLRLQQRSHYVIPEGGDQPNVVPPRASVWYYFRELDYSHIQELFAVGDTIARAAAMMTGTRLASVKILGSAWPQHFNRVIAETMYGNIVRVGLPVWSEDDQTLARAVQREVGVPDGGLALRPDTLRPPPPPEQRRGGASDDIGDVSWAVPTVTLRFPSNIPHVAAHHWAAGIAMATPIAHKGATAGATVMGMTILDFVLKPALVDSAWRYFRDVQTRTVRYRPLIRPEDRPATEMNAAVMARFRPAMRRWYYDPSRYGSYLEQLGIRYPTLKAADGSCPAPPATSP
jgi:aminobenzoyl-glutamate utilization protein B